jgi:hypothetical protein
VICEQCWQVEYTNKEVLTRGERGRLERLWSVFGLGFEGFCSRLWDKRLAFQSAPHPLGWFPFMNIQRGNNVSYTYMRVLITHLLNYLLNC